MSELLEALRKRSWVVARSFEEFLALFTKEAHSNEPEYPFFVYL